MNPRDVVVGDKCPALTLRLPPRHSNTKERETQQSVVICWGLVPGTEIPPRGLVPGTEKARCVVVDGDLSPALTTPIVGRRNDHRTVHLRPLLAESA